MIGVHAKGEELPNLRGRRAGSWLFQIAVDPDNALAKNTENAKLAVIDEIMRTVGATAVLYNNKRRTSLGVRIAELFDEFRLIPDLMFAPPEGKDLIGKTARMTERQNEEGLRNRRFLDRVERDLFSTFFGIPEQPDLE